MTLHFQDRRGAASLYHRNRAKTPVLVCEQKPFPVLFRGGEKVIWYSVNIALIKVLIIQGAWTGGLILISFII